MEGGREGDKIEEEVAMVDKAFGAVTIVLSPYRKPYKARHRSISAI